MALFKTFAVNCDAFSKETVFFKFFILLTVHHDQERQIVSIQPLVAVSDRVVCRSEFSLPTCTLHGH